MVEFLKAMVMLNLSYTYTCWFFLGFFSILYYSFVRSLFFFHMPICRHLYNGLMNNLPITTATLLLLLLLLLLHLRLNNDTALLETFNE